VNAVRSCQFLDIAVLGEQGHGRSRLAQQNAFEVFGQREAGAFHLGGRGLVAQLGPLDELLHRRFHRPQDVRRRAQPDHLERSNGLVQLLPRDAQLAAVH
jgi:hypothetical protein